MGVIAKMEKFIREKKRNLTSTGAILINFIIIMVLFVNYLYLTFNSIQRQDDLLSSGVKAPGISSLALKASNGDLAQNVEENSSYQSLISSLEADLKSIPAKLSGEIY